jgi:hypothetical protein
MQFQVPQFIETEDKIVGPLTLRQFLYLALVGGAAFILFFMLEFWLWLIIAFILFVGGVALAFIKINGRPMSLIIQAAFAYFWNPRVYTLKPKVSEPLTNKPSVTTPNHHMPVLGGIKNLLNKMIASKEAVPKREKTITPTNFGIPPAKIKERYEILKRITGEREIARRVDYR